MPTFCIVDGCNIRSTFNIEGEKKRLYCSSHKADGMVNVANKMCLYNGCEVIAKFNTKGEKRGLYCSIHKADGMINVTSKKCLHNGCNIRSTFNIEGEKIGLYCSSHKADGMVDVATKKCHHNGCKIVPIFNIEGEKRGLYCSFHKTDGMVDVTSKKCHHNGCDFQPVFNTKGEKRGIYCLFHKADGMINVVTKTCLHEWCMTVANKSKYEGYCLPCYMHVYPDRPVTRNYKTKEYSVVDFIQKSFPDFTWIADKKVSDGCSRRRPDMLLDLGDQVVIVEVDENQHTGYDCSCENKRLMELSQDVGHRPIVFIRFNPDDYLDNGTKVNSCWGLNKMGICAVKKTYARAWALRLDALAESISYWTSTENRTDKTVEVVELFYDR